MTQKIIKYKITDPSLFKFQVIQYVRRYDTFCFLDSNDCKKEDNTFDYLIAFSKINETEAIAIGIMAPPPIACKNLKTINQFNFEGT